MDKQELVTEAVKARAHAYAPYSSFAVGAALLGQSGRVYHGCNVENASYGATICAERVALTKAVSEGETEFQALAVVCDTAEPVPPCGICRQVLAEFTPHMEITMATLTGTSETTRLDALYPNAFGEANLGGRGN
ncbi:MAG: cytidine deaminase [Limnochordia bacterium]|jgi:cytidine deaminase